MPLPPWEAALVLSKNEAICSFSLGALSVLPLISLSPSLLCRRQFQDSCWLDSFFSTPAYIYSWPICASLFKCQYFISASIVLSFTWASLQNGGLLPFLPPSASTLERSRKRNFFSLSGRNVIPISNLCLFFSCWR